MDVIQATATAARIMQWAAAEPIAPPLPDYVTVSSTGGIGFQMRSFDQVKEWAVYLEVEFDYSESITQHYTKPGETHKVGFANARRTIDDAEHGTAYLHVYHNAIVKDEPQPETLFDVGEDTETISE